MSQQIKIASLLLLFLLSLTWGSSYILIKKSLITFSPIEVAILRMSIACLMLAPFSYRAFKRTPKKLLPFLLFPGWIGAAGPSFLYAQAQTDLSSSLTGIISSTTPLMTLVLGILFFGLKSNTSKVVGIVLGFIGTYTLVSIGDSSSVARLIPVLMVIVGTICYALSTNAVHKWLQQMSSLDISSISFAMVLPVAFFFLLKMDVPSMAGRDHFSESLAAIVALSLFGTVIASTLYFRLVQIAGALFASMVSYIIPLIALFWGMLDGETFHSVYIFGMAFILCGVYLAKRE